MLYYRKGCAGLYVAFRVAGTAWPYGILPGLLSASIGLALGLTVEVDDTIREEDEFLKDHYPFQLFAYLVGVLMVFRTNFAYRRYWFALDAVYRMGSKWLDGACLATAADAPGRRDASLPYLADSAAGRAGSEVAESADDAVGFLGETHSRFFTQVAHLFSLAHALALQHLRRDQDLTNLEEALWEGLDLPSLAEAGAAAGRPAAGGPAAGLSGSGPSAGSPASGSPATGGPAARAGGLASGSSASAPWMHPAQGSQRLGVLGRLSPEEVQALATDGRGQALPGDARVSMVICWIMRRLIARQKHEIAGDMCRTSPPILSRMFALLSDGDLAFSQAKWIAEVPFPFPYHNLKEAFLWIFATTVPIVVNAKISHHSFRFFVNFLAVWSYFSLSKVGDDLEDPFTVHSLNQLPLDTLHHGFNVQLLCYGTAPRPPEVAEMWVSEAQHSLEGDPGTSGARPHCEQSVEAASGAQGAAAAAMAAVAARAQATG